MLGSLDSGGSPHPHTSGCFCVGFGHVKSLAIRNKLISKLCQHFRACPVLDTGVRGHPAACPLECFKQGAYGMLCLCFACLVRPPSTPPHRRKTRYGRVANPYLQGLSPCKIRQASLGAITNQAEGRGAVGRVPLQRAEPDIRGRVWRTDAYRAVRLGDHGTGQLRRRMLDTFEHQRFTEAPLGR